MRYSLPGGVILRTENAAKPASQASGYLSSIIRGLPSVDSAVDYGCGKLRYLDAMLHTTDRLAVVDSEVQLSRPQVIFGSKSTIRSWVGASNRLSVFNTQDFAIHGRDYDRGFCINVLSAIPFAFARENALRLLRQSLRKGAECLFVVQYRNSDFTRMARLPYARRWQGGILLDSLRGYSFYALISPRQLADLVRRAGFIVGDTHLNDGSVYMWGKVQYQYVGEALQFDETDSFRRRAAA